MSEKSFHRACSLDELPEGATKIVELGGKQVLVANDGGKVQAVSPHCTHDGELMDVDKVEDHAVTCPRHGARFDLRDGSVLAMPAVFGLASYETKVEHGEVHVAV